MSATRVATAATMEWLGEVLPEPGRLLEVGCGGGEVAAELGGLGWAVTAIDAKPEAVEAARGRGVDARVATFPDIEGEGFDALLFARVLHHVGPLDQVLGGVRELLVPGGVFVVEDYDWARVDAKTAAWGYGVLGTLAEAGLAPAGEWDPGEDALGTWREMLSSEGLHTGEVMLAGVRREFEVVHEGVAPYFYRYVCKHLEEHERGAAIAARVLGMERELIGLGAIEPLGLRFTARNSPAE